jgi:A/G-specific adenine glycosylase
LWELPGGAVGKGESLTQALLRAATRDTGVRLRVLRPAGTIRQAYSHFAVTLHAFHCEAETGRRAPLRKGAAWVADDRLRRHPCGRAARRLLEAHHR